MLFSRTVLLCIPLALLTLSGAASAQTLELLVREGAGPIISITDNGAFDTDLTVGAINVNVGLLNSSLVSYQFANLGANQATNSLSQAGSVSLRSGGTGSLSVSGTATTFLDPFNNPKTMTTSAADSFRNTVAGDLRTFQSFFNPSNTLGATQTPSPLLAFVPPIGAGPFNIGNPGVVTSLGNQPTPYGLTNNTVITLGGSNGSDQFSGTTTITAPPVPEPGSIALLVGAGLSSAGFLARRKRAHKAA